jgi:hypothetical protein
MATNRYSGYSAKLNDAIILNQVSSVSIDPGGSYDELIPAGLLDRQAVVLGTATPGIRITTRDLATFFGDVSASTGLACEDTSTFQFQQRASGGAFSGGSTFWNVVSTLGFLMPTRLGASNGGNQEANLDALYVPLYDGTNVPLVANAAQAVVASTTPAYNSSFHLGPVYINSVLMEGIISSEVNFGIGFETITPDGSVYPTAGSIIRRMPSLSFTMLRHEFITTNVASMFIGNAAGTVAAYFYKAVNGGARVAAATTSHCKVTATASTLTPDSIAFSGNDDSLVTITVRPKVALAVSVSSAVP